jgi:hypothetical protein
MSWSMRDLLQMWKCLSVVLAFLMLLLHYRSKKRYFSDWWTKNVEWNI